MFFYSKQKQKFEFYPKAFDKTTRFHGKDQEVLPTRRKFLKLASINFIILQTLFLCLFAYIYGALYQAQPHAHDINFVFVDYDGGIVGTAFRDAYNVGYKGDNFPTIIERTPEEYANEQALRTAVCRTDYWAAVFISPNASSNFIAALAGGPAAQNYNRTNVITFIWNEARFGAVMDGLIATNMLVLSDTTRATLIPLYVADTTRSNTTLNIDITDPWVSAVLAAPWGPTSVNIKPMAQGSRLIYNTLLIVLLLIQDFFYLGTINGLYAQFNMYAKLFPHRIIAYRLAISLLYTFVGSLCTVGMLWAFRYTWDVNAAQFVESWMVVWLFAHLNFLALDFFTIWLPLPYVPLALITWVVFNVTSVLLPFDLSNSFYKWAYMIPAHAVFNILIDIWSDGCNPTLRWALPALFALELSGLIFGALGVYRRSHYAVLATQQKEKELQERVNLAIEMERKHNKRRREEELARQKAELEGVPALSPDSMMMEKEEEAEEVEDRRDLEQAIAQENAKVEDEEQDVRTGSGINYDGICFPLFDAERTRSGLSRTKSGSSRTKSGLLKARTAG